MCCEDRLPCDFRNLFPFQKVVDLVIGDAVDVLVRAKWGICFEIGRRELEDQFTRCAEMVARALTRRFIRPDKGRISTALSPDLVKNPVSASAA